MNLSRLLAVARGDEPADLVFRHGRVVNTFTAEVEETDVAVAEGHIAGLGPGYHAAQVVELGGAYLVPGLISGHTHIESSHLTVGEYARAVVPRGTLTVVSDLHEVANVAGLAGLRALLADASDLPCNVHLMVPPCVPATELETAGARLGPAEVAEALTYPWALGLGEMMNFPAAIAGVDDALAKLAASRGRVVDGHAPGLSGHALNAYLAAGPRSDHETTRRAEGQEKLRRGMLLMIREGTSEKNLDELLPLVTEDTYPRCIFVVDDRSPVDLRDDGEMDAVVRKAVVLGLEPLRALQLATINPARYFGLADRGAIAPGYAADLFVTDDLRALPAGRVYFRGRLVAEEGVPFFEAPPVTDPALVDTMHAAPITAGDLTLAAREDFPVIEVVPGQIITRARRERPALRNGAIVSDPDRDLLKLTVVERHQASGRIGLGLVRGFGLQRGALASSFSHDSHNIVAVGVDDADLTSAIGEVIRVGGGLTVTAGAQVLATLPLPVAGLMAHGTLEVVARQFEEVERAAREIGVQVPAPFALLSFLALPVIPEIRLTDRGVVDVLRGEFLEPGLCLERREAPP